MKAVDYFLLTNFGFIFLSFLEYVLVLNSEPNPEWFRMFTCSLQAVSTYLGISCSLFVLKVLDIIKSERTNMF